ncbi:MAG: flagellar motor protein MotB [Acidobacteriota bacterium]
MSAHDDSSEHRGGAWKVAYADFVTALMALFIVLWLMGSSGEVRKAVSSYFRDPKGYVNLNGSSVAGSGEALTVTEKNVQRLKEKLEREIKETPELQKMAKYVKFTVTGEGLRIELMESNGGMFFETGSPRPTPGGANLFQLLAGELRELPNQVTLEGHTDSKPFRESGVDAYGNWELSFDRANMARRLMLGYGLQADRVAEIRGYADRHPITDNSADSRNRRVSVVLRFEK